MGYVYPFDRDVITVRFAATVNFFPPCGAFSATLPPLLDSVIDEYYAKAEHIDTLNEALAERFPPAEESRFSFFTVTAEEETEAVMLYSTNSSCKIFINGTLVSLCSVPDARGTLCRFQKGENRVVIQKFGKQSGDPVSFRFSRLSYETADCSLSAFLGNEGFFALPDLLHSDLSLCDGKDFSFLFSTCNRTHSGPSLCRVTALGVGFRKELPPIPFSYGTENAFSFAESLLPAGTLLLRLDFGEGKRIVLSLREPNAIFDAIVPRVRHLSESGVFSEEKILEAEHLMERFEEGFCSEEYRHTILARLTELGNGEGWAVSRSRPVFFRSKLDGRAEKLDVTLPASYDESKRYPLFVQIVSTRYAKHPRLFEHANRDDVLFAFVSGRGFTMGSYVGDASIQEAISVLCERFSVDCDRLYAVGVSNGGAAALIQAQLSPDRFAGIAPLAGLVRKEFLTNLRPVRIINTSSKDDAMFGKVFRVINSRARKSLSYTGILTEAMSHQLFTVLRGKDFYVDELLKTRRDPFPNHIAFRTGFHRYLSCFWIRIHGIRRGKHEAFVSAEVRGNEIAIRSQNAVGLTVTIPPQVDKHRFAVTLNGKRFVFTDFAGKKILFCHSRRGFSLAEGEPDAVPFKGTGLLDVYLSPMRVVCADAEDVTLSACAEALARPSTMGHGGRIFVRYPIYGARDLPEAEAEQALAVVDCCRDLPLLNNLRKMAIVSTDQDGFSYGGERFDGPYCVMQVLQNPRNPAVSVLYINCNDSSMLKKNLFTRKMILPSYYNGFHPYLNNEALIFRDGQFFAVRENGMPLVKVT